MKLVEHFNNFLIDTVNLNSTRITQLDESISALKGVIYQSEWKPKIKRFVPQGSWAHKTIIKPIYEKPFDADILVFVDPLEQWEAKDYITSLRDIFANHGTYKDKVKRYSHCITIEYVGERKIDIAPCIVNRGGLSRFEVCKYDTDTFEASDPEKYTEWLITRNGWTGGNTLRKVTRLLKYLRDIKGTFSCPSVLLTTLLGDRISWADSLDDVKFDDLPTALKTITGRLDDWLQANSSQPTVRNPVLASEVLSEKWDEARYTNFRSKINTYRSWIDDAFAEPDRDESIGKWRRVFGDDFAKSVTIQKAARVSDEALVLVESAALVSPGFIGDLVTLFSRFGRRALPASFDRLPHKQRPRWRTLPNPLFQTSIVATRHTGRDTDPIDTVSSGTGPLLKDQWLRFQARTSVGTPVTADFEIQWRVTNTDKAAERAQCLRGGFEPSNDGASRWEQLEYRGVHSVEAFIVRKRDQVLVSQSDPFYVVIE